MLCLCRSRYKRNESSPTHEIQQVGTAEKTKNDCWLFLFQIPRRPRSIDRSLPSSYLPEMPQFCGIHVPFSRPEQRKDGGEGRMHFKYHFSRKCTGATFWPAGHLFNTIRQPPMKPAQSVRTIESGRIVWIAEKEETSSPMSIITNQQLGARLKGEEDSISTTGGAC